LISDQYKILYFLLKVSNDQLEILVTYLDESDSLKCLNFTFLQWWDFPKFSGMFSGLVRLGAILR